MAPSLGAKHTPQTPSSNTKRGFPSVVSGSLIPSAIRRPSSHSNDPPTPYLSATNPNFSPSPSASSNSINTPSTPAQNQSSSSGIPSFRALRSLLPFGPSKNANTTPNPIPPSTPVSNLNASIGATPIPNTNTSSSSLRSPFSGFGSVRRSIQRDRGVNVPVTIAESGRRVSMSAIASSAKEKEKDVSAIPVIAIDRRASMGGSEPEPEPAIRKSSSLSRLETSSLASSSHHTVSSSNSRSGAELLGEKSALAKGYPILRTPSPGPPLLADHELSTIIEADSSGISLIKHLPPTLSTSYLLPSSTTSASTSAQPSPDHSSTSRRPLPPSRHPSPLTSQIFYSQHSFHDHDHGNESHNDTNGHGHGHDDDYGDDSRIVEGDTSALDLSTSHLDAQVLDALKDAANGHSGDAWLMGGGEPVIVDASEEEPEDVSMSMRVQIHGNGSSMEEEGHTNRTIVRPVSSHGGGAGDYNITFGDVDPELAQLLSPNRLSAGGAAGTGSRSNSRPGSLFANEQLPQPASLQPSFAVLPPKLSSASMTSLTASQVSLALPMQSGVVSRKNTPPASSPLPLPLPLPLPVDSVSLRHNPSVVSFSTSTPPPFTGSHGHMLSLPTTNGSTTARSFVPHLSSSTASSAAVATSASTQLQSSPMITTTTTSPTSTFPTTPSARAVPVPVQVQSSLPRLSLSSKPGGVASPTHPQHKVSSSSSMSTSTATATATSYLPLPVPVTPTPTPAATTLTSTTTTPVSTPASTLTLTSIPSTSVSPSPYYHQHHQQHQHQHPYSSNYQPPASPDRPQFPFLVPGIGRRNRLITPPTGSGSAPVPLLGMGGGGVTPGNVSGSSNGSGANGMANTGAGAGAGTRSSTPSTVPNTPANPDARFNLNVNGGGGSPGSVFISREASGSSSASGVGGSSGSGSTYATAVTSGNNAVASVNGRRFGTASSVNTNASAATTTTTEFGEIASGGGGAGECDTMGGATITPNTNINGNGNINGNANGTVVPSTPRTTTRSISTSTTGSGVSSLSRPYAGRPSLDSALGMREGRTAYGFGGSGAGARPGTGRMSRNSSPLRGSLLEPAAVIRRDVSSSGTGADAGSGSRPGSSGTPERELPAASEVVQKPSPAAQNQNLTTPTPASAAGASSSAVAAVIARARKRSMSVQERLGSSVPGMGMRLYERDRDRDRVGSRLDLAGYSSTRGHAGWLRDRDRERERDGAMSEFGVTPMTPPSSSTNMDSLGPRTVKAFKAAGLLVDTDRERVSGGVGGALGPSPLGKFSSLRGTASEYGSAGAGAGRSQSRMAFSEAAGPVGGRGGSSGGGGHSRKDSGSVGGGGGGGIADSPTYTASSGRSRLGDRDRDVTPRSASTAPTSLSGGSYGYFGRDVDRYRERERDRDRDRDRGREKEKEREKNWDRDELAALKEKHQLETGALLGALSDSQRTCKMLREENSELRDRLGRTVEGLEKENERLRRAMEELREEMEVLRKNAAAAATAGGGGIRPRLSNSSSRSGWSPTALERDRESRDRGGFLKPPSPLTHDGSPRNRSHSSDDNSAYPHDQQNDTVTARVVGGRKPSYAYGDGGDGMRKVGIVPSTSLPTSRVSQSRNHSQLHLAQPDEVEDKLLDDRHHVQIHAHDYSNNSHNDPFDANRNDDEPLKPQPEVEDPDFSMKSDPRRFSSTSSISIFPVPPSNMTMLMHEDPNASLSDSSLPQPPQVNMKIGAKTTATNGGTTHRYHPLPRNKQNDSLGSMDIDMDGFAVGSFESLEDKPRPKRTHNGTDHHTNSNGSITIPNASTSFTSYKSNNSSNISTGSNGNGRSISPTTANFSVLTGSPGSLFLRPEHELHLGDMDSFSLDLGYRDQEQEQEQDLDQGQGQVRNGRGDVSVEDRVASGWDW